MSSILEVNQVYKYFGGVKANENISLNVEQGSIVGLIGPNGSGKTTLALQASINAALTYKGKKVVYVTPSGKEIVGKITRKHGQKWSKFIVRFDRNVCIEPGTKVEVKE